LSYIDNSLDMAFSDPPYIDAEYPFGHVSFRFMRGSEPVFGHIWVAQGAQRKGVVVIPPQTWGGDSIESAIYPLLRCGINAISFVPTGMWDRTQPTYTMNTAVDDVHALVDWIRSRDFDRETRIGSYRNRLDPERIALFGLSGGGGNVGFAACGESDHVHHAAAVVPTNMEHRFQIEPIKESYEMVGRPWFAEAAIEQYSETLERLSIIRNAQRLASKTLLIVSAYPDPENAVEFNHTPIVDALRVAGAKHLTDVIMAADHSFMTKRNALAKLLIEWLRREASF
jgi:hypothetical protein